MGERVRETSTLPLPEFPLKKEERDFFLAEQAFLAQLPGVIAPEIVDQSQQREILFQHIADLSSTQMAREVFLAYGFTDGRCHSDIDVGEHFQRHQRRVNWERKVVIQTLWLLYSNEFSPDLFSWTGALALRYLRPGETPRNNNQKKVLERVKSNLFYYLDRAFVLKRGRGFLTLLGGLYGEKVRDIFDRYYRLDEYREAENFEKRGNLDLRLSSSQTKLMVKDVLEAGRATAEYMAGLDNEGKEWTDPKGRRVRGYRRKGRNFPVIFGEYQTQMKIAKALMDSRVKLEPTERELLALTTSTRLRGGSKSEGLREFNEQYQTNYDISTVRKLELKALGEFEGTRLVIAERVRRIKIFLDNEMLKEQLAQILAGILYGYHVVGQTIAEVAEEISFPISYVHTGELKRFLERLVIKEYEMSKGELPKKGEITEEMIDRFFADDALPQEIISILQELTKPAKTVKVAEKFESQLKIKLGGGAIVALMNLTLETVKAYERETVKAYERSAY